MLLPGFPDPSGGSQRNGLQERLSEVKDSDIAEVMVQLQAKLTTYQAALGTASRINDMTLLNYLS